MSAALDDPAVDSATVGAACYCLALKRATRNVARRYDEALRPQGLNNGQFSMLMAVSGLQPVSMQALADRLAMDRTTVTAALKPLLRRGLVQVGVAENDLRGREIRLTATGAAQLAAAVPLWEAAQRAVAAELAAGEGANLRRQLSRLA